MNGIPIFLPVTPDILMVIATVPEHLLGHALFIIYGYTLACYAVAIIRAAAWQCLHPTR